MTSPAAPDAPSRLPKRVVLAARVLVGAVFAYAGLMKIWQPPAFAESVASFHLLPAGASNLVALGLPPFEVFAGVLLAIGIRVRVAALATLCMSVVFAGALAAAAVRGLTIDCGCFGTGAVSVLVSLAGHPWLEIARDGLFAAISSIIYLEAGRGPRPAGRLLRWVWPPRATTHEEGSVL